MAQSPTSLGLFEACGTAHHWARTLVAMGHDVALLPAQHVRPYRRGNKNDRRDADALLEAGRCDDIEPVPIKTEAQQAVIQLHRLREQWKTTRTARINSLRGALREFGIDLPVGAVNAIYYKVTEQISGSAPATVYYDQLGRVIRKLSTGFDGKAIYQDTEYDAQGREYRSSLPYFVDDPAYWVVNHYDEVNRVVKKSFDTGKGTVVTQIDYQGLTTIETNTLGQVKRTTKNALGKVVLVEEEEGGKITYEYDAIGNLLKTHQHDDANAKVVTTELWYDVRGQKTAMQDPDMGYWTYQHNAFGELVSQTDAKNQSVSMTYDKLGRMTRRVEPEGETVWTYDTAEKGIGKLHKVEQFDTAGTLQYRTENSYDNFGRE